MLAISVAARLCALVAEEPMPLGPGGQGVNVTVSIGVTVGGELDEPVDALLKRADEALYRAKNSGRNRVEAEPG